MNRVCLTGVLLNDPVALVGERGTRFVAASLKFSKDSTVKLVARGMAADCLLTFTAMEAIKVGGSLICHPTGTVAILVERCYEDCYSAGGRRRAFYFGERANPQPIGRSSPETRQS